MRKSICLLLLGFIIFFAGCVGVEFLIGVGAGWGAKQVIADKKAEEAEEIAQAETVEEKESIVEKYQLWHVAGYIISNAISITGTNIYRKRVG